ncbi:MAG: WecB/TagA/CpsF family glycosyltransferase [Peptococcaceae bacterium]|nr:WecB/TagA/CpsF family glycosyltransferase [Peptococcaceae bacterium]
MDILGTRIDLLNLQESMSRIFRAVASGKKLWIVTANPELIYRGAKDKKLQATISSADFILPDGIGVVWAAHLFGAEKVERVTGIDLTLKILEEGQQHRWRIFLLGSKPEIVKKAVYNLRQKYPAIDFAYHHGYFSPEEEPAVLEKIERFAPHILLVGLGAPKQEYWNAAYKGSAQIRMGVGGTIDVLSGEVKRAPQFFRAHNLEWLYRLVSQPARIRRQIVLPLYVCKVLKQRYFS